MWMEMRAVNLDKMIISTDTINRLAKIYDRDTYECITML